MKIIKLGLISIIVFGLMLLAFTGIMPSHVRISRALDIKAPAAEIEQVLSRKRTEDKDFVYQWSLHPFDTVTVVQLYYDFHIKWYQPFQKLSSLVYDQQLGPVMEQYLRTLKTTSE